MDNRIGNWNQTFTGGMFWPLDPRPSEVKIEDIAHALSLICRFGGHVREFYSVAQHSILVSRECTRYILGQSDPRVQLWGLLHDAAEAYVGDMISPIKRRLEMGHYRAIEGLVLNCVLKRFGLFEHMPMMPQVIRICDERACATEARDLMAKPPALWWDRSNPPRPFTDRVIPIGPAEAERVFLERFYELTGMLRRPGCGG